MVLRETTEKILKKNVIIMESGLPKIYAALAVSMILCGLFVPYHQLTLADTGGPADSGQLSPGGLRIFNNSGNHWNLVHGDDLSFNDSLIHMNGNLTLQSSSNLTLINCTLNITGWIDVKPGSRLILKSSIINFNQTGYCQYHLNLTNASLDISDYDDQPSQAGYTSLITSNNSKGFEFNASGSWLNMSDVRISGAGNETPLYDAQKGIYLTNCQVNISDSYLEDCNNGLAATASDIAVSDTNITGTHGIIAAGGTISMDNTTINTTSTEVQLSDITDANITGLSVQNTNLFDMEIIESNVSLNLSSGNAKLLNSTYNIISITRDATAHIVNYINVNVLDHQGQAYAGTVVSIKDKTGAERYNLSLPAGSGSDIEITSMVRNATATVHYNPYNFTATHPASIVMNYTEAQVNSTSTVNLTLPQSAYNGNWNITGEVQLINKTIKLYGNVNITSDSTLTLRNTTLIFMPAANGQFMLIANSNSSLFILDNDDDIGTDDGSLIKSGTDSAYLVFLNRTREFAMRNSEVRNCGYASTIFPLQRSGFFVGANNTTVRGSKFVDCHTGLIYIKSRNATITGNSFTSENGILLINTLECNISGNSFTHERNDIYLQATRDIRITGNVIKGRYNRSDRNSTGIEMWYSQNSTVKNNTISGKGNCGVVMAFCASNNVSYNIISESANGINVSRLSNKNILYSNVIRSVDVGLNINNSKINTISANDISIVNVTGINAYNNKDHTYLYNKINGSGTGFVYKDESSLLVHNNSVTNATVGGVHALRVSDWNITNNTFENCNNQAVVILGSSRINMTGNYLIDENATSVNSSFHRLMLDFGDMVILNTTTVISEVRGNAVLTTKWYLNIRVLNSIGLPIPGTVVTLFDLNGTQVAQGITTQNGTAMRLEAVQSKDWGASAMELFTPHTVRVEYGGLKTDSTFYINSSLTRNLTLNSTDVLVDWVVDKTMIFQNIVMDLWGNLTVKNGGKLTFRNFTLKLHVPGNGTRSIVVENGGELYLYGGSNNKSRLNSTGAGGESRYRFWVKSGGTLRMDEVIILNCGYDPGVQDYTQEPDKRGLFIESDKTWITDCELTAEHIGVVINSTVKNTIPLIASSRIQGGHGGILVLNSDVYLNDLMMLDFDSFGIMCLKNSSYTSLKLADSMITNTRGAGITMSRASLHMNACHMLNINGTALSLDRDSTGTITNCDITGNSKGVLVSNSSLLYILNSTLSGSETEDLDVREDSVIELVNTVPFKYYIPPADNGSKIWVKYFVSFVSVDEYSYRVPYTTVTLVEHVTSDVTLSTNTFTTNDKGEINYVLATQQEIISSGVLVHYYDITASKDGFSTGINQSITFNNITRKIVVVVNDVTPPEANAGPDKWIYEQGLYEFDGSDTVDNVGAVNFSWSFVYAQNNVTLYGTNPSFRFDNPGIYNVTLAARDMSWNEGTDNMILTVRQLPRPDSLYYSEHGISATLFYENKGKLPTITITLLSDELVSEKGINMDTINLTFAIGIEGIADDEWDHIEVGINYADKNISHITDENTLDLYIETSDEKWVRADSLARVDTSIKRIHANVTFIGNLTVMGRIDISSPFVLMNSLLPAENARNVPLDTIIRAKFSENVKGVDNDSFVLLDPKNNPVSGNVLVNGATVTLSPQAVLSVGSKYTVMLTKGNKDLNGNKGITDLYDNILKETVSWSFRTLEAEKNPEVLAVYPEDDQEKVSVKTQISIAFSKPMELSSFNGSIEITPLVSYKLQMTNDNKSVILVPNSELEYDTLYSVVLHTGIRSISGRTLGDRYKFNFTTEEEQAEPVKPSEKDDDGLEMTLTTAGTVLAIVLVIVLVIMMYVTFRNRYARTALGEEITEEIGEVSSCPQCGAMVDPGDKVCSECGLKLKKSDFKIGCKKCGTPLDIDDKKCPSCGFVPKKKTKPLKKEAGKEIETDDKNKCPFCSAEIEEEDAESCPICGEGLVEEDSDFVCDKCGASVDPDEVLCPYCGESFFEDEMICSECGAPIAVDDEMCPECGELFDEDIEINDLDEDD